MTREFATVDLSSFLMTEQVYGFVSQIENRSSQLSSLLQWNGVVLGVQSVVIAAPIRYHERSAEVPRVVWARRFFPAAMSKRGASVQLTKNDDPDALVESDYDGDGGEVSTCTVTNAER